MKITYICTVCNASLTFGLKADEIPAIARYCLWCGGPLMYPPFEGEIGRLADKLVNEQAKQVDNAFLKELAIKPWEG